LGYKLIHFGFKPEENEQIETIVKMPEEPRSIIHGKVMDNCDKPIKDAVVKLFELPDPECPCDLTPLTHTFTDECGQFIFGPLTPYKHYVIKVWYDDVKVRYLPPCPWDDKKDPKPVNLTFEKGE
jgi:hypothetical protein